MKFLLISLLIVLAACSNGAGSEASSATEEMGEGASTSEAAGGEAASVPRPTLKLDTAFYTTDPVINTMRKQLREYAATRFSGERAADTVFFDEEYIILRLGIINAIIEDNANSEYMNEIRDLFKKNDLLMVCSDYDVPDVDPAKVVRPYIHLKLDKSGTHLVIKSITDTTHKAGASDVTISFRNLESGTADANHFWLIFWFHPAPRFECVRESDEVNIIGKSVMEWHEAIYMPPIKEPTAEQLKRRDSIDALYEKRKRSPRGC